MSRVGHSLSRVGHGLSRVGHGSKPQNQSMVTRVVTVSRLQTPMCHPLSHQSAVKADLSRLSQAKAGPIRLCHLRLEFLCFFVPLSGHSFGCRSPVLFISWLPTTT